MLRLPTTLLDALRLIGLAVGFGSRLIANERSTGFPNGDEPFPGTKPGADQAEVTFKRSH